MSQGKDLILEVATLYYIHQRTQEEIAQKLFLSRSKVSRLLKLAREDGYVSFVIDGENSQNHFLSDQLSACFPGIQIFVSKTASTQKETYSRIALSLSDYLLRTLQPKDVIAVARGTTLQSLTHCMPKREYPPLSIAQIIASLGNSPSTMETELNFIKDFAAVFHASAYNFYSPFALSSKDEKEMFLHLPYIRQTLTLARRARFLLLSLGSPSAEDTLWRTFLTQEELSHISDFQPAGTYCGYFFSKDGEPIHTPWNERIMGLDFQALLAKEHRLGVVIGRHKAIPTLGALRGSLINALFTDEDTALEILIQNRLNPPLADQCHA